MGRLSPKGDDDFTTTPRGAPHCVSFLRHWKATAEEVLRACPPALPFARRPFLEFLFPLFVSLWRWSGRSAVGHCAKYTHHVAGVLVKNS